MRVNDENQTFEAQIKNVQRGQDRVAEMECHVQCLRKKLCRLEKMLPPPDENEGPQDTVGGWNYDERCSQLLSDSDVCPIDKLARKEKFLRNQIYDMECTEQAYIRKIEDFKANPLPLDNISSVTESSINSARKEREILAKERLVLLESYSQKINNNLQSLEKNHDGLKKEAQNLSLVADRKWKNGLDKEKKDQIPSCHSCCKPRDGQPVTCGCKLAAKCNSCIICSCKEWEQDLENGGNDQCHLERKPKPKKCVCDELSVTSGSDESCDCGKGHKKKIKRCTCNEVDNESTSSNCSNDDCSEKSKCTCYCSQNESHDEFLESDCDRCYNKDFAKVEKIERCRGGLDMELPIKVPDINLEIPNEASNDLLPVKSNIADHLKLIKVEELREGLERLKIRNRNLKDFLRSLENPLMLVNKPSEATTACTEASSCYTLDVASQTRSGLLNVVKTLEGKCRSKDAIIVALADELKTGSVKKMRMKGIELNADKSNVWENLMESKEIDRRFTKKDSAIGFLVFVMILISHVKRSEMISYLNAAKKIFKDSSFQAVLLITETDKFPVARAFTLNEKVINSTAKFMDVVTNKWEDTKLWLLLSMNQLHAEIRHQAYCAIEFFAENQYHILYAMSLFLAATLIVKHRKALRNYIEMIEYAQRKTLVYFCKAAKSVSVRLLRFFNDKVLSSKIFWYILGISSHILWNIMGEDIVKSISLWSTMGDSSARPAIVETPEMPKIINNAVAALPEQVDYFWIFSILNAQFQNLIVFWCYLLKSMVV